MKKFIAPVAATAAALALVAPIAPADAAQLTRTTQDGQVRCRIDLGRTTDAEYVAGTKAGNYARTLTNGAEAIAYVDGIEAAVKGAKAVGDKYVVTDGVLHVLWEPRGLTTEKSVLVRKAQARDAAISELAKLGLAKDAAEFYLDQKEIAQNPEYGVNAEPTAEAKWYIGINGGTNLLAAPPAGWVRGKVGESLANKVPSLTNEQRYWFIENVNASYFGKVRSELEWTYESVLRTATQCTQTDPVVVMFPSSFTPGVERQQYAKNTELPKPEDAAPAPAPKPDPKPETKKPAPENPVPEKPAPRPNPNEGKSSFDAELSKVIGIIAAVLAALGALFGILNAPGVKGLPTIPQIPGQWG